MNKFLLPLVIAVAVVLSFRQWGPDSNSGPSAPPNAAPSAEAASTQSTIARAFRQQAENVAVSGAGEVVTVLDDDLRGSRHQRFILRVGDGHTVLVAHNIDIAPRIADLRPGDRVRYSGIYEYNAKGGVVHWTHGDPGGRHAGGWLEHEGRRYQ